MQIFSSAKHRYLTQKIIEEMEQSFSQQLKIGQLSIERFSDGEIFPRFYDNIHNQDILFLNSLDGSDSIIETMLVADAAKRAGCKSFTLVCPYLAYCRQDKMVHKGTSIGAQLLANILEKSGIDRLVTIDLHSDKILTFYNIPVIHISGNSIYQAFFLAHPIPEMCIVSPDQGGVSKVYDFSQAFPEASVAVMHKKRIRPNEVHSLELHGEVVGKNVVILDDIADTLGTLKKAAQLVMDKGAISVRAVATHGVLSGSALANLEESLLTELIISDSLVNSSHPKLRVISCCKVIAHHILRFVDQ